MPVRYLKRPNTGKDDDDDDQINCKQTKTQERYVKFFIPRNIPYLSSTSLYSTPCPTHSFQTTTSC
jgi:hypothetical protein